MWFNFPVYSFAENAFFFPNTMGSFCSLSLSCLLFHTSQHSRRFMVLFHLYLLSQDTRLSFCSLASNTSLFSPPPSTFYLLILSLSPPLDPWPFIFLLILSFRDLVFLRIQKFFFCVAVFLESSVFSSRNIKSNCILQEKIYWCTFKKATITALIRKGASNSHKRGIWGRLKVGRP